MQPILNLWQELSDSLQARWERARSLLAIATHFSGTRYIMGYSMGCHLAIKFARELVTKNCTMNIRGLYLLAIDPRFRRVKWDKCDEFANRRSAYDEAIVLWEDNEKPSNANCANPGMAVQECLAAIDSKLERPIRLIFSKVDPVAEWHQNVETLWEELQDASRYEWIEAETAGFLLSSMPEKEDWVHCQIFEMLK